MEAIYELKIALNNVIEAANKITDETTAEIFEKAPFIIHQRFCSELVKTMKQHPNKKPIEVPEAMLIINAVSFLEKCYPHLNKPT